MLRLSASVHWVFCPKFLILVDLVFWPKILQIGNVYCHTISPDSAAAQQFDCFVTSTSRVAKSPRAQMSDLGTNPFYLRQPLEQEEEERPSDLSPLSRRRFHLTVSIFCSRTSLDISDPSSIEFFVKKWRRRSSLRTGASRSTRLRKHSGASSIDLQRILQFISSTPQRRCIIKPRFIGDRWPY